MPFQGTAKPARWPHRPAQQPLPECVQGGEFRAEFGARLRKLGAFNGGAVQQPLFAAFKVFPANGRLKTTGLLNHWKRGKDEKQGPRLRVCSTAILSMLCNPLQIPRTLPRKMAARCEYLPAIALPEYGYNQRRERHQRKHAEHRCRQANTDICKQTLFFFGKFDAYQLKARPRQSAHCAEHAFERTPLAFHLRLIKSPSKTPMHTAMPADCQGCR